MAQNKFRHNYIAYISISLGLFGCAPAEGVLQSQQESGINTGIVLEESPEFHPTEEMKLGLVPFEIDPTYPEYLIAEHNGDNPDRDKIARVRRAAAVAEHFIWRREEKLDRHAFVYALTLMNCNYRNKFGYECFDLLKPSTVQEVVSMSAINERKSKSPATTFRADYLEGALRVVDRLFEEFSPPEAFFELKPRQYHPVTLPFVDGFAGVKARKTLLVSEKEASEFYPWMYGVPSLNYTQEGWDSEDRRGSLESINFATGRYFEELLQGLIKNVELLRVIAGMRVTLHRLLNQRSVSPELSIPLRKFRRTLDASVKQVVDQLPLLAMRLAHFYPFGAGRGNWETLFILFSQARLKVLSHEDGRVDHLMQRSNGLDKMMLYTVQWPSQATDIYSVWAIDELQELTDEDEVAAQILE